MSLFVGTDKRPFIAYPDAMAINFPAGNVCGKTMLSAYIFMLAGALQCGSGSGLEMERDRSKEICKYKIKSTMITRIVANLEKSCHFS